MEYDWVEQKRREAQDNLRSAERRHREAVAETGGVFTPRVHQVYSSYVTTHGGVSRSHRVIFRVERDEEGVATLRPVDSSYPGYERAHGGHHIAFGPAPPGILALAQEELREREEVEAEPVERKRLVFHWSVMLDEGHSSGGSYEFQVTRDEHGKALLLATSGRRSSIE